MYDQARNQREISPADWLAGAGEMVERIRAFDWAQTPLGPIQSWSPALRTTLRIVLTNRFPHVLWWGPRYIQFYNDAYRPIPGSKHPERALGRPASECWSEIWHIIGPLIDRPFSGGPATWDDDIFLEVHRHGFLEETHFTIAYSPVPDDTAPGGIGGVLATVHEITEKVVGERRVVALRDLGSRAVEAKSAEEACAVAAETLSRHARDVPFALLYLIDADGKRAHLAGAAGVAPGGPAGPLVIDLEPQNQQTIWPLRDAVLTDEVQYVGDLAARFGDAVPSGPWSDPPREALIIPIRSNIAHQLAGILVAGVSPRLKLDDLYRSFFELVAAQIATAIANAQAHEHERQRAEALAELDRAKTAFFANVSHEFRTPLTLMLGPLQDALAQPNGLSAEDRERLEVAHRNSVRLLKLVNTLLDFSRIEAGRVQASYEPVDLAALTVDLASVFRSAIEKAGLKLIVDCPPLGEPVYVDREMWEKVVLNLLSNAFKFTFKGEVVIKLRREAGHAVLTVRDTGVGIAAEQLPHVFERFHRLPNVRARTHEGTGIGLALVQELIKLHGGAIGVESTTGEGTTFIVRVPTGKAHLPADRIGAERRMTSTAMAAVPYIEEASRWLPDDLIKDKEAAAQIAENPASIGIANQVVAHDDTAIAIAGIAARGPNRQTAGRPRVLWADDNADMREYVRRLLSPNYEVEAVSDGESALAAARARRPDLILADVMMPNMGGFDLLRAIRKDERLRTVPLIMLSARAGEESRVEGLEAGADDYLIKPFSARELLARVGAQLQIASLRREAEQALRAKNERVALVSDALGCLVLSHDLERIVRELLPKLATHLGVDAYFNYMVNTEGDALTLHCYGGISEQTAKDIERLEFGEAICGTVAQTREPIVLADIQNSIYDKAALVRSLGIQAYACNPLISGGRLLGTLSFASRSRKGFADDELEFIQTMSRYIAIAMERAQSEEKLRQAYAELRLHAQDLTRFNRAAVARELRMIELKKEINELCEQQGGRARYALEFEAAEAEPPSLPRVGGDEGLVPLESIVCTDELNRRSPRPPDYEAENRALTTLVRALADSPRTILQALADKVLEVLHADSAGLSLLTNDEKRFYWAAIAGAWQPHIGGGTPRDFGPCGDVLNCQMPMLFTHWERRYPYLLPATPLAEEGLLVPFYVRGKAVGTIWAIAHSDSKKFDGEDLRLLESLGRFASAAYQAVESLGALDQRRAALSLMEDAVESQRLVENLNAQLRSEIGERRRAEEDLQKLNSELEERVTERTAELLSTMAESKKLQEQLLQAQKMESIGTLAGGIAHDFNNILNIIQGHAFILRGCSDDNDQIGESLAVIDDTVQRGSTLVQQLLTMARKSSTRLEAVSANAVVQKLNALIRQTFPKTIESSAALAPDLPLITADKNQIEQALLNLCVNARDAMPNGGRLIFRTEAVDAAVIEALGGAREERYVCIEVSDTGAGIDEAIQKRIFEPFFTTKDMGQGTGLGLSVVYGIVQNHRGVIDVKSSAGCGASFRLYFPVSAQLSEVEPVVKREGEIAARSEVGATVFVVEDEQSMLHVLETVLAQHGYRVLKATDGKMALEIYQTHRESIDVILLDIGLPKITGLDVLSRIKEQNPGARVIVASGYLDPELRTKIHQNGVQHFVHKPYVPVDVIQTIRNLTARRRGSEFST